MKKDAMAVVHEPAEAAGVGLDRLDSAIEALGQWSRLGPGTHPPLERLVGIGDRGPFQHLVAVFGDLPLLHEQRTPVTLIGPQWMRRRPAADIRPIIKIPRLELSDLLHHQRGVIALPGNIDPSA